MVNPTLFMDVDNLPVLGWWSGGITSAIACKLALQMFSNVKLGFIETGKHHKDTQRFKNDCEKWYGQEIVTYQNRKYRDPIDVILSTGYVNGPSGARCTEELKKQVRYSVEMQVGYKYQIWGYDFRKKEINRAIRFLQEYPHTKPIFPLLEYKVSKNECAGILQNAGIKLPEMYILGYDNNNCIGCPKGGKGYWNKIRKDFPDVFNEMAEAEREVNHSCINGTFLDELNPRDGNEGDSIAPECGAFCQSKFEDIDDKMTDMVLKGTLSLKDYLDKLEGLKNG